MKVLVTGAEPRALIEGCALSQAAGHELVSVASVEAVREAFGAEMPPGGAIVAGPDAAEEIGRLRAALRARPAWLVAWVQTDHAALAALAKGADDVLVGPMVGAALLRRMAVGERQLRAQKDQLRLRYLARHPVVRDPLTGALRTEVLAVQAELALARSDRTGTPVTVVALESVGEGLPREADLSPLVLARIAPLLRRGDAVAMSEDRTLLALLEGCDEGEARGLADRMLQGAMRLPQVGAGVAFTAAVGVAVHAPPGPPQTARQLIDAAGSALARAWMSGGQRVEVAGPPREEAQLAAR